MMMNISNISPISNISDDYKQHDYGDDSVVVDDYHHNDSEVMLFEHARCHDTQLVLVNEFNLMMHENLRNDKLFKSQRMNLNRLLFEMYDIWQPLDVNSNCGQVHKQKNSWHWKFNYDLDSFCKLFTEMINAERNNTRRQILQKQLNHVIEKHQEWKMVKERDQLQQIARDFDLYLEIMQYTDYTLPTRLELAEYGGVSFVGNIKFEADQYSPHFNPQCTRLLIEIPTYIQPSQFRMSHYQTELSAALETLIDLVTISADIAKQYVAAKVSQSVSGGDAKRYCQPLSWFELGITTKCVDDSYSDDNDEERNVQSVVIVVYAQITIMHYIFLLIQKYEAIQIQRWSEQYMDNINHRLGERPQCIAICDHKFHHLLHFELKTKELINHIHIGNGTKNRRIKSLNYNQNKNHNHDNNNNQDNHDMNNKATHHYHQQPQPHHYQQPQHHQHHQPRFPLPTSPNRFRNYATSNKPNKSSNSRRPKKSNNKNNRKKSSSATKGKQKQRYRQKGKGKGNKASTKKEKEEEVKMRWQKKCGWQKKTGGGGEAIHNNDSNNYYYNNPPDIGAKEEKEKVMNEQNWRRSV